MRRFPAPFAALLQERAVCGGLLLAGLILVTANACGISLWHCAFLEATGKPCPGCGLTRGMSALCHGEVARALRFHPFTPMFALGGLVMLLAWLLPQGSRARPHRAGSSRRVPHRHHPLAAHCADGVWCLADVKVACAAEGSVSA